MKYRSPQFIQMKSAGKPHAEIAAAFGARPRTVDWWVTMAIREGLLDPTKGRMPTPATVIDRLRELWAAGLHIDDVVDQLGKTRRAIRGLLVRYKITREIAPVRKKPEDDPSWLPTIDRLKREGKTDRQIGKALNISQARVARLRKAYGLDFLTPKPFSPWDEEAEKTLRRLWLSGLSCHLIGQQMGGRTANQIASKARRLGLSDKGAPLKRKVADRDYKSVAAAASARKGTTLGPKARQGPVEDPHIIPDFARPWLTRALGECAYPYGPRGQVHSCCKPVFGVSQWCESHHALCTTERKVAA